MIKSSGAALDKINTKIADSTKKRPLIAFENALPVRIYPSVPGAYMLSGPSFNPEPSITLPMLPRKFIRK